MSQETRTQRVAGEVRAQMAYLRAGKRETAVALGLGYASFAKRYSGAMPWSLDELQSLADTLGVPFAHLVLVGEVERQPLSAPRDAGPPVGAALAEELAALRGVLERARGDVAVAAHALDRAAETLA